MPSEAMTVGRLGWRALRRAWALVRWSAALAAAPLGWVPLPSAPPPGVLAKANVQPLPTSHLVALPQYTVTV